MTNEVTQKTPEGLLTSYEMLREVDRVIGGGQVDGDLSYASEGVIWYGSPDDSASVRAWIWTTWNVVVHLTKALEGLYRWYVHVDDTSGRRWYYALEVQKQLHVVGGCTDFSGEGGRARRLAEAYMSRFGLPVTTRSADHLVAYLVEGYGPYIVANTEKE